MLEKLKRNKYQATLLQNGQILNWKPSATRKGSPRSETCYLNPTNLIILRVSKRIITIPLTAEKTKE
jgi:hypothetical protein